MRWLTADLPGTGGVYKEQPEDFQVEEIPLYPCSGSGEHLYLTIEKEGLSTRELLAQLTRALRVKDADIGYAGLKDARARTIQRISVPARCAPQLDQLQLPKTRLLRVERHGNKLRLGHLAGNRFSIRLREVHPDAAARAEAILTALQEMGVPNRFGEQRYGVLGNSARLGMLLVKGEFSVFSRELLGDPEQIRNPDWQAAASAFQAGQLQQACDLLPTRMRDEKRLLQALLKGKSPRAAVLALPRNLLRLLLSAAQSQLFDQLLEQRLPDLGRLENGDLAYKHDNGACFRVEDAPLEQPRADRFAISPTAPLYGVKALLAEGEPGARELGLLQENGLTLSSWKLGEGLTMPGERRPLRVPLDNPQLSPAAAGQLCLSFSLPKGSYATSVLNELIK